MSSFGISPSARKVESGDKKSGKKIILGNTLRFEKAADCINAIKSNFTHAKKTDEMLWGSGSCIEDKSILLKNNNPVILTSEQRMAEINSNTTFFIFKK